MHAIIPTSILTKTQVFSCISRKLNTYHALSLPKLQKICDDAYTSKTIISHTVLENNFAWWDWLEPHVIKSTLFNSGLAKVRRAYIWFRKFGFREVLNG